jgi:ribosomal protein S18 acetylase RimI-like enzyme
MIYLATGIAKDTNEKHSACRFITVDADVEHNKSVIEFYRKNGFLPNGEMNNKRGKTISMRKDILR